MSEDYSDLWLVYSREHNAFWRPKAAGYTYEISAAGRYSKEQADGHCNTRDAQPGGGPSEVAVLAPEAADAITALQRRVADLEDDTIRLNNEKADRFEQKIVAECRAEAAEAVVEAGRRWYENERAIASLGLNETRSRLKMTTELRLAQALDRLDKESGHE